MIQPLDLKDIEPDEIVRAAKRVLSAPAFNSSPSMRNFITYVVEETLAGRKSDLKAYTIAVDALGKSDDFDAQLDPTVRVLAGRVRTALDLYYSGEGADDPIRIEIPKGTYRPEFNRVKTAAIPELIAPQEEASTVQETFPPAPVPSEAVAPTTSRFNEKIAVGLAAVLALLGGIGVLAWPFLAERFNLSPRGGIAQNNIRVAVEEVATVAAGGTNVPLADDLAAMLARNKTIVVSRPNRTNAASSAVKRESDFKLRTRTIGSGDQRRAMVTLSNSFTDQVVWSRSYKFTVPSLNQTQYDDRVLGITRELSTQIFGASIKALQGRNPETLSASQLFVLATWTPGSALNSLKWEKERVELARLALKKNPNFGPAHSVLADKLAYLAAVDGPSDTPEALTEGLRSAKRAMELSPDDVNAVFNTAQFYWHSGNVPEATRKMKRALEIDPSHGFARFFSNVLPYTCSPAPDDVLAKAVSFDRSLDSDNPIRWVTQTWLGWLHLNRNELAEALAAEQNAAQIFQIPYTVMRHAAVLNALGRTDEAVEIVRSQKENWPNINPFHFAEVTMPRLCSQIGGGEVMINHYKNLADDTARLLR